MTTARETVENIIAKIRSARNVPEITSALAEISDVDSLSDLSADRPGIYTDRRVLIAIDDDGANYSVDLSTSLDYKTELLVREARQVASTIPAHTRPRRRLST